MAWSPGVNAVTLKKPDVTGVRNHSSPPEVTLSRFRTQPAIWLTTAGNAGVGLVRAKATVWSPSTVMPASSVAVPSRTSWYPAIRPQRRSGVGEAEAGLATHS